MDAFTDILLVVCGLAILFVGVAHLRPALLPLLARATLVGPAARVAGGLLLLCALALIVVALGVESLRPLVLAAVCAWGGAMGVQQGRIALLGEAPRKASPGTGVILVAIGLGFVVLGLLSLLGG